jgi:predicted HTH transcriptional regulator
VRIAKTKRGFPLSAQAKPEKILTHLNLISEGSISNAAVLLFGVKPQHFLISSEIKCVQFNGTKIEKPFPAYQVYKGDVFQLVNQAVDFVLSRIDLAVGTRNEDTQAPLKYEIPRAVIAEAIVNAIAHRDYNSTGR